MSLSPVSKRLGRFLQKEVVMANDCIGPEIEGLLNKMKNGDVVLLENLRFHSEEQKNDDARKTHEPFRHIQLSAGHQITNENVFDTDIGEPT